jgi:hypothetical protein
VRWGILGFVVCLGCSFASEGGGGGLTMLGETAGTSDASSTTAGESDASAGGGAEQDGGSTSAPPMTSADATGVGDASDRGDRSEGGSDSGETPIEICNGIDDDRDGFVDEWSELNDQCGPCVYVVGPAGEFVFAFCDDPLAWLDADAFCMTIGGRLASIHDPAENDLVWQNTGSQRRWIGFTDADEEDVWIWTDGTPTDFVTWNTGQPNNADGGEHCATMLPDVAAWHDTECENLEPFVCRAPK